MMAAADGKFTDLHTGRPQLLRTKNSNSFLTRVEMYGTYD